MKHKNSTLKLAAICGAVGWMCWMAGGLAHAQNSPTSAGPSPDLQEVVKLSQARMPDDVIKNYINSTGRSYHLSADDIIYLNSQGVSPSVISTLQTAVSANPPPQAPPTPPPPEPQPGYAPPSPATMPPADGGAAPVAEATPPPPPPADVNFQYFHDELAPYGTWMNVGGVMYWHPDQAIAIDPDWRPYYDMGQWVQTDNGLYWQSDYTWGDIPFHYGRWVLNPSLGWLWAPDYTWGPAWVFWRHDEDDGAIGWAPLPVGAVFINGGFFFRGVAVGADFDFGLGEGCFTFVDYAHFHEGFFRMRGHEWAYHIDHDRLHSFYHRSVVRDDFRRDDRGRFINFGIGRDRVDHLTRVEHANFEERNPVGDRNRLAVQHGGEAGHVEDFRGTPNHGSSNGGGNGHPDDFRGTPSHGEQVNPGANHGTLSGGANGPSDDFRSTPGHGEQANPGANHGTLNGGANGRPDDFRGTPSHGEQGNPGANHGTLSGGGNPNFGSGRNGPAGGGASKVYRPPSGGGSNGGGSSRDKRQ